MVKSLQAKCVDFFNAVVTTRYQIIILAITASVTLLVVREHFKIFRTLEPSPELLPITAKKITAWKGDPALVKAGLYITNFPEFNVSENKFIFDGVIWFEFDKSLASLETIGNFTFEKGEILFKSKPTNKIIGDNIFAEYVIRVRFSSNLSYDLFPFDDHRIFISVMNSAVSPGEVIFESYKPGFIISKQVFTPEWEIVDTHVETGYVEAVLDVYDQRKVDRDPKIIFSFDIVRSGSRQAILILLPLFLIFFLSLFSFGLDPVQHTSFIMAMTSGAISAMIGYRFVIQRMSPEIGYFVLGDQVFTLLLAFAFIQFLLGIVLIIGKKITPLLSVIRGVIFLSFHIIFWTVWTYLILYWNG